MLRLWDPRLLLRGSVLLRRLLWQQLPELLPAELVPDRDASWMRRGRQRLLRLLLGGRERPREKALDDCWFPRSQVTKGSQFS